MNTNIKNALIAILIMSIIGVVIYFMFSEKETKQEIELKLDLNSDIVSKEPRESAANFITAAGTIGDYESLTEKKISRGLFKTNSEMREESFNKAKDSIIPDGPLLTGREIDFIREDNAQFPLFYRIEDLKVGKPYDEGTMTVNHDGIGAVEYETVKVNVDFKSIETAFYWSTDVSLDGYVSEEESSDNHENVVVVLAKSGDLWFIYDVEDSEYELNARLATWSGKGQYDFPYEKKVIKEYPMESVYHFGQEEMFND